VAFAGGNDTGNYRASLGFVQKQGALRNSDMRKLHRQARCPAACLQQELKLEFGIMGSEHDGKRQYDMQKMFYSAAAYNPTYPNYKNTTTGKWDEDMLAQRDLQPIGTARNRQPLQLSVHSSLTERQHGPS
jgi:hypothetical protein